MDQKNCDQDCGCRTEFDPAKKRSNRLVGTYGSADWLKRAPARGMMRAVGFTDADFRKPLITPYTSVTPCNAHLRKLGDIVANQVEKNGGKPVPFGTPVVTDGETMGMESMKYSLVSRDLITDCIETMHEGYSSDGMINLCGCDKTIPAALMAVARNNSVGIVLYGGTILPGRFRGKDLNIVSISRPSASYPPARLVKRIWKTSKRMPVPAVVPAAVCIRPTPWLLPSKLWV